jgi:phage terminase large subunit-like protein
VGREEAWHRGHEIVKGSQHCEVSRVSGLGDIGARWTGETAMIKACKSDETIRGYNMAMTMRNAKVGIICIRFIGRQEDRCLWEYRV